MESARHILLNNHKGFSWSRFNELIRYQLLLVPLKPFFRVDLSGGRDIMHRFEIS